MGRGFGGVFPGDDDGGGGRDEEEGGEEGEEEDFFVCFVVFGHWSVVAGNGNSGGE